VIGGVGGSGTRVYRAIAEAAGYRMLVAPWFRRMLDRDLHDNLLLAKFFYTQWIDSYLANRMSNIQLKMMQVSFKTQLWISGPLIYNRGLWGWKNPRTIFLIPFLSQMYQSIRYIHVIRDGRDHAFHPRFTYLAHQDCVLSAEESKLPGPQRKALFWSRANRMGEAHAKEHLPGRYIRCTLETLCSDPVREVGRILAFLGSSDQGVAERASTLVEAPSSLGRWRVESPDQIAAVEDLIGEDLLRYGYKPMSVVSSFVSGVSVEF
jgi:hypothetical protein